MQTRLMPEAMNFYVDPESNAARWVEDHPGDPRAPKIEDTLVHTPTAKWFGDWNQDIASELDAYLAAAARADETPLVVLYNMYLRDNGGESGGGAASPRAYRDWIDAAAQGIGDHPVIVVTEPDSLAQLGALPLASQQEERIDLVAYASTTLGGLSSAQVYLDGGNTTWISEGLMASRLRRARVTRTRGLAVNVSNFDATDISRRYAQKILDQLAYLGHDLSYTVDTSRNGNGALDEDGEHVGWCNPPGRKIGTPSTVDDRGGDYLLWIKVPGDSDGSCGTGEGIPAGQFSPDLAEALIDGS